MSPKWQYHLFVNLGVLLFSLFLLRPHVMSFAWFTSTFVSLLIANAAMWWSLRLRASRVRHVSLQTEARPKMKPKTLLWLGVLLISFGIIELVLSIFESPSVSIPDLVFGAFFLLLGTLVLVQSRRKTPTIDTGRAPAPNRRGRG